MGSVTVTVISCFALFLSVYNVCLLVCPCSDKKLSGNS